MADVISWPLYKKIKIHINQFLLFYHQESKKILNEPMLMEAIVK